MQGIPILHGEHAGALDKSKLAFAASSVLAVAVCWWLGLGSARARDRALALIACGLVFVLRTVVMVLCLNPRRLGWLEAIGDSCAVWAVLYGLLVFWAGDPAPLRPSDIVAGTVFLAGSMLTTGSELARRNWKQRPENRGHLYTAGPFRYARHINYFGEVVSFTGFALLTLRWWAGLVPLAMLLAFVFIHIPALERHLQDRYRTEFPAYSQRTKKLIPFLY